MAKFYNQAPWETDERGEGSLQKDATRPSSQAIQPWALVLQDLDGARFVAGHQPRGDSDSNTMMVWLDGTCSVLGMCFVSSTQCLQSTAQHPDQ